MSGYDRPSHQVYMYFFKWGGWHRGEDQIRHLVHRPPRARGEQLTWPLLTELFLSAIRGLDDSIGAQQQTVSF
jgi:hypothetical protein